MPFKEQLADAQARRDYWKDRPLSSADAGVAIRLYAAWETTVGHLQRIIHAEASFDAAEAAYQEAERVRNAAADALGHVLTCYEDSYYQSQDLESAAVRLGCTPPGEGYCAPE
jgi:hypothetical protein